MVNCRNVNLFSNLTIVILEEKMRNKLLLIVFTLIFAVYFSAIASAGINDGLIVYYPFDETSGTSATDDSKNGNDAELTGNAAWATDEGKIGGALRLDGSASSAEDADGADYINGLEEFSVSVWVKSDTAPHDFGIFHGIDPAGADDVFTLRYDSASWDFKGGGTNLIKAGISTTSGDQRYESANNTQTTEWQHIVLTWKSGEVLSLYIDGVLDEPVFNSAAAQGEISKASKFVIGRGAKDNNGTSWTGLVDEVRLYNRVIDANEIDELASGVLPVEPTGKLATTWGDLKQD